MTEKMQCAYCCKIKEYPKDFPSRLYAICEGCYPEWVNNDKSLFTKIIEWFDNFI